MNSSGLPSHCFHLAAVRAAAASNSRGWNMNTETIPQRMINGVTDESHVIQLLPKEGLTAAQVAAFLADCEAEAKLINPENCETTWWYAEVLDPNGMFRCARAMVLHWKAQLRAQLARWIMGMVRRLAGSDQAGA